MAYTENGVATEMPKTVEVIFAFRETGAAILWSIKVTGLL
jgi:hypothetical protein